MSKEYTLADFTDIFDYSTGWFSDSSICSLFYQIFKRFPSMKMVKYKVNQDFLKEIKELYQQDDAFDIFEHVYCNHFENEKEEKSYRLQLLLKGLVKEAVQESNEQLAEDIKESVIKELDYQFRIAAQEQEQQHKEYQKQQEVTYSA